MTVQSGRARRMSVVSATIATLTLAAACSSNAGSNASTSGSQPGSRLPTADASVQSPGNVTAYLKPPTKLPVTTPVSKPIPTGVKIVFLAQPFSQSLSLANGLKDAATVLGWTVQVLKYDPANPPTFTTSLNTAISEKPGAIVITGALRQQFAAQIPAARAAHIPLVPTITPEISSAPDVYPVLNSDAELGYQAKMIADTILADAAKSGKTAHVLQITVPEVAAYLSIEDRMVQQEIATNCSGCSRDLLKVNLADLFNGNYTQQVVSYLQGHPDINYIISDSGQAGDGLGAALSQAGITNVKRYGIAATNLQIEALKSGQPETWTIQPFRADGWIIADQVARVLVGDPTDLWTHEHLAYVVTSANIPDVANPDDVPIPADYQEQFKKLWHK